jgi:hypothetical protein
MYAANPPYSSCRVATLSNGAWSSGGPPERDNCLIPAAAADRDALHRYERATNQEVHPTLTTLCLLGWYLDDLTSAVRSFRNPHTNTPIPEPGALARHPASRAETAACSWPFKMICAPKGGCPDILIVTCPKTGSMMWKL